MKKILLWLGLAVAASLLAPTAFAQAPQDIAACSGLAGTAPQQQLKACDAVIAANNFGGQNMAVAFAKRCAANVALKQHAPAIADCTKAVALEPADATSFYARAGEYEATGDTASAVQDYDRAIAIDGRDFNAYSRRGWIFARNRQYDRAIADFSKAIEFNENGNRDSDTTLTVSTIFGNRCWVRALANQFDTALTDCNSALNLEITVGLIDDRGFVYYRMGDYAKAITQYNLALKFEPASAASLLQRGLAEAKNKEPAKAKADIAAAKAIQPDIAEQLAAVGLE